MNILNFIIRILKASKQDLTLIRIHYFPITVNQNIQNYHISV